MKVLVIPEDSRNDAYILQPVIDKLLAAAGFPRTKVIVCRDPHLGSVERALNQSEIQGVVDRYPMVDLFLLIVDRDGQPGRADQLRRLELETKLKGGQHLLGENAWQEVEVWLLAGHTLPKEWNWSALRNYRDPKERYYEPFAKERGVWGRLGQGRKTLGQEAAKNYSRIRQLCDEVRELEGRIAALGA